MINRIISNKFFKDTQLINDILNHESNELVTHGESEFATVEWLEYNKPYLEAIKIAKKYVTQLEEDYGCVGKELDGVWVRRNIDFWELDDHEKHENGAGEDCGMALPRRRVQRCGNGRWEDRQQRG